MDFKRFNFGQRLSSMIKVDLRKLFTTKLFYIMIGICLVTPILVLVMTTLMDGSVTVDPQTGVETVIEGFDNTWQMIGSVSSDNSAMSMGITSMCNINMIYFIIAVIVCIFVSDDFRSGYNKILFAGRAKKSEYVISKTFTMFLASIFMILFWVIGTILGGAISSLPFSLGSAGVTGLVMCILSKILLTLIFISIFVLMSVVGKNKLWLSLIGSFMIGMLFYMIVPVVSPLDSTIINVVLSFVGGLIFSVILGIISNVILKKTDLV